MPPPYTGPVRRANMPQFYLHLEKTQKICLVVVTIGCTFVIYLTFTTFFSSQHATENHIKTSTSQRLIDSFLPMHDTAISATLPESVDTPRSRFLKGKDQASLRKGLVNGSCNGNTFAAFFEGERITHFRREYLSKYSNNPRKKLLSFVLGGTNGFGSVINSALNAYVLSQQREVDRTFQIHSNHDTSFTLLYELFDDFTSNATFPLLPTRYARVDDMEYLQTLPKLKLVKSTTTTHKLVINGAGVRNLAIWNTDSFFRRQFLQQKHLFGDAGFEKIFRMKAEMTRALWNPRASLKKTLQKAWCWLDQPLGGYYAIHIRRGDKILLHEMLDIPLSDYYEKLEEICSTSGESCRAKVFLMSDDENALDVLRGYSQGRFEIYDLARILGTTDERVDEFTSSAGGNKLRYLPENAVKARLRNVHSRELVLSITLLAMADQLICTFSSNICRLAAVLRGDHTDRFVHSLDVLHWHPF